MNGCIYEKCLMWHLISKLHIITVYYCVIFPHQAHSMHARKLSPFVIYDKQFCKYSIDESIFDFLFYPQIVDICFVI